MIWRVEILFVSYSFFMRAQILFPSGVPRDEGNKQDRAAKCDHNLNNTL